MDDLLRRMRRLRRPPAHSTLLLLPILSHPNTLPDALSQYPRKTPRQYARSPRQDRRRNLIPASRVNFEAST